MNFTKFNSIDLDYSDKEIVQNTIDKISLCKSLIQVQCKPSSMKGYHALMLCSKECDICRLVYDDQKRFMIDLNIRKPEFRNLLWDKKEPLREKLIELVFKK